MKSGLWVVIVLVTGIVGFLFGYSVSAYTGVRKLSEAQASESPAHAAPSKQAAAPAAPASGYGGTAPQPAAAGGYGGAEKPAPKPPPVKPAAAGY
jgi:hypothetical protein